MNRLPSRVLVMTCALASGSVPCAALAQSMAVVNFHGGDGRLYTGDGDWYPGDWKGECGTGQPLVAGVSHFPYAFPPTSQDDWTQSVFSSNDGISYALTHRVAV